MKPLFSAFLETIVLIVSILIVMLGVRIFKYESPYVNYSETHPNSVITIGQATGYVSEGVTSPEKAASEVAKKFLGKNTDKSLPLAVGKFLCTEVSENTAKVLEFYSLIVFLESILCVIFGITLPCSLYRRTGISKKIADAIVDKRYVYVEDGITFGHVGEGLSDILRVLLFFAVLFVTIVWCTFMPLVIAVNCVVGVIALLLRAFGLTGSESERADEEEQTDAEEVYRLTVEYGHFAVTGSVHPNRRFYFKQYRNAVIAKRIFELDRDHNIFQSKAANETVYNCNEDERRKFEKALEKNIGKMRSKSDKKRAADIENIITNNTYTFTKAAADGMEDEFLFLLPNSSNYMMLRYSHNSSLLHTIMKCDSEGREFAPADWENWNSRSYKEMDKHEAYHTGKVAPPQGEKLLPSAE